MQDNDILYEELASHLDRLPAGFPRTSTGVELRILRRLFTPEQAALAVHLARKPESPAEIAGRTGKSAGELEVKLEEMSRKGLIFRIRRGDKVFYMASQFVVGIWEYQVNNLDAELIRDVDEYLPHLNREEYRTEIPVLRTIPISRALSVDQAVMPYDAAREIIAKQEKFLVAPCICRKEHHISGKGCDKPVDTCLVFGLGADYYEENGIGRVITREEALEILDTAEAAGLVLQPSNSQNATNICTCCACCCQILRNLKALPNPAHYVASNYFAAVDSDRCSGCGTCTDRCPMEAVTVEGGGASIDPNRCIGCGLCVTTCPGEALRLEKKSAQQCTVPPRQLMDTHKKIAIARIKKSRQKNAEPHE